MDAMRDSMSRLLSGLEVDVLRLYVEGRSYQEIGEELGRHVKSIDNALQRIKRKLEVHIAERDEAETEADSLLV
jgi:RNA polymerase sporulation-specific sigma factor